MSSKSSIQTAMPAIWTSFFSPIWLSLSGSGDCPIFLGKSTTYPWAGLRSDVIKVIDSDGHARDMDEFLQPYLAEPFRKRRLPYIPREVYDLSLGGTQI